MIRIKGLKARREADQEGHRHMTEWIDMSKLKTVQPHEAYQTAKDALEDVRYTDNGLPEDEVQRARRLAEEALRDARGKLNGLLIAQGAERLDTADTKRWMDILASVILEIEPL